MESKPKYTAISLHHGANVKYPATFIGISKQHVKDYSLHTKIGFRVLWVLGLLKYVDEPTQSKKGRIVNQIK